MWSISDQFFLPLQWNSSIRSDISNPMRLNHLLLVKKLLNFNTPSCKVDTVRIKEPFVNDTCYWSKQ